MNNLEELKQDIEEIREVLATSKRARVKDVLQRELIKLEQEMSLLTRVKPTAQADKPTEEKAAENTPEEKEAKPAKTPIYATKITSYAWDQSDKFVKIYITLPGVENVPKEGLVSNFGNKSMDVTVKNLNGKNYQLQILRLCGGIIPSGSYLKAKAGTLTVMMKKEKVGESWADVLPTSNKEKKDLQSGGLAAENKDPSAGIMDMMKKMYDEGDDEMKKTISKAWLESREKQGGAGLV